MSSCHHEPRICDECGGVALTTWTDITDSVRSISINDGPPLQPAEIWLGELPGPCPNPTDEEPTP